MKTVAMLLSTLAIGAGVVVGSLEHRSAKDASPAGTTAPSVIALPPPPPKSVERKKRAYRPGELDLVAVEDTKLSEPAPPSGSPAAAPPPPGPAVADPALRVQLEGIAALLDQEDFAAAEKAARELAAGANAAAREPAERLAARARVFRQVASRQPQAAAGASFEVLLANGLKVSAREFEEGPDGYVFRLMKGAVFAPARDDVLEIRKLERKEGAAPAWKDLQPRIAGLTHPIDIFVEGVERCLHFGYRKEAFRLLAGLLARGDSDQLPLLFFPDAGDAFARDWRVAGGRAPPDGGSAVAGVSGDRLSAPDPELSPAPGASTAEAGGEPDQQGLAAAERLIAEARGLLQAALGKDGRSGDLQAVRERLDRALALLEPLPHRHDAVKRLRREIAQLLSDASRTVSF